MNKKIYYLFIFIFSFSVLSAQEKLSKEEKARREKNIQAGNPFAQFGYKAKIATLSKGKYLEFHDLDSIVTIGTVRWHVYKNEIVGRIVQDSINPDAQPIGDRVGRWMSPDPLSEEFSSWSPYTMSFNNPIQFVDPDGRAPDDWRINYVDKQGNSQQFVFNGGATALPDNQFVRDFVGAYNYNVGNGGGDSMKAIAENPNITVDVQQGEFTTQDNSLSKDYNVVNWNPNLGIETTSGNILSPATLLEHEAGHALAGALAPGTKLARVESSDKQYRDKEEKRVTIGIEQKTARANGEIGMVGTTRTDHKGLPVVTKSPTSNTVDRPKTYNTLNTLHSKGFFFPGFGVEDTEKYRR